MVWLTQRQEVGDRQKDQPAYGLVSSPMPLARPVPPERQVFESYCSSRSEAVNLQKEWSVLDPLVAAFHLRLYHRLLRHNDLLLHLVVVADHRRLPNHLHHFLHHRHCRHRRLVAADHLVHHYLIRRLQHDRLNLISPLRLLRQRLQLQQLQQHRQRLHLGAYQVDIGYQQKSLF